ncbi:hypothetical protein [Streptomyces sp. NPDC088115]|uniref:hypothetical protein n=1 Tax=Streptomyces sp. NPDC088115 TaxID=3365824 RepID=UPI0038020A51
MTAIEFRTVHGDPTTWTVADHETYDNLRRNEAHLANTTRTCWFCAVETATQNRRCGFCGHHADDNPTPAPNAEHVIVTGITGSGKGLTLQIIATAA